MLDQLKDGPRGLNWTLYYRIGTCDAFLDDVGKSPQSPLTRWREPPSWFWTGPRGVDSELLHETSWGVNISSLSYWPYQTDRLVEVRNKNVAGGVGHNR